MELDIISNFHNHLRKIYWVVAGFVCVLVVVIAYNIYLSKRAETLQDHIFLLEQQEKSLRNITEEDRDDTVNRVLILQRQIQQLQQERRDHQDIWL